MNGTTGRLGEAVTSITAHTASLAPVAGRSPPGPLPFVACPRNGLRQPIKVWFVGRKSALGHVSKKLQTEELYEALGKAADALIEMQAAVDAGLGCLEELATDVESKLTENQKH